jgi:hypothetical protein
MSNGNSRETTKPLASESTVDPHGLLMTLRRRQLATPLLLILAGHRPLTFLAGQALYAAAPLGALLGWENVEGWAELLSAPDAGQQLEAALAGPPGDC